MNVIHGVTFSISRDVEPRLPVAAAPAQASPPRASRLPRAARLAAALAGLAAIGAYLFVALGAGYSDWPARMRCTSRSEFPSSGCTANG